MARLSMGPFALAAALALIGCAGQTSDNSATNSKEALFKAIDQNGDGSLSQPEIHSWLDRLDTDGNGAVSYAEWKAAP